VSSKSLDFFQLAKKMSGMFHTLKDALPTFEEGQGSIL
jgi:hypothetical protein